MRSAIPVIAFSLSLSGLCTLGTAALAQVGPGSEPVVATITKMTEAVNEGQAPQAFAAFTASPWIVDDGAPQAWLGAMGANAQAKGMTAINMKLSPATRVEVEGDHAYAVMPGLLSYRMKDGHSEHADGVLTFTLLRSGADWKIDSLVWSGPQARR